MAKKTKTKKKAKAKTKTMRSGHTFPEVYEAIHLLRDQITALNHRIDALTKSTTGAAPAQEFAEVEVHT